ncbi:hypothetical protein E0198_004795 [Clavispora lusitaniae]|nr:hypothetical protein E0198_004795 [Clavispora lusitaniae]
MDPTEQTLQLREKNESAWRGDVFVPPGKLDSSLKKNTGFIKKVRTSLNAQNYVSVLKDIGSLSLEKYVSEVSSAVVEGVSKISKTEDFQASVAVISALHQRFPVSFTPQFLSAIVNGEMNKDTETSLATSRSSLRLLMELSFVGIGTQFSQCDKSLLGPQASKFCTKYETQPIVLPLLKHFMSYRFEDGFALPVVVSLSKRYGDILKSPNDMISEDARAEILQTFTVYTKRSKELFTSLHSQVARLTQKDFKASIRTGRILDENQADLRQKTELEKIFASNMAPLCEIFNVEYPSFEPAENEKASEVVVKPSKVVGWWEDAREKSFYTEFSSYEELCKTFDASAIPSKKYAALTEGEKVALFVQHLSEASSEEDVDRLTVEFHSMVPYNKATRNRLLRFFSEIRKSDNFNIYARFLKINADVFPELLTELVEILDRGFRTQIHHGAINFRNLTFFIELVKFKLVPLHMVFHKVRRMTMDIGQTGNVDVLSVFYERCGKFLLFEPEYSATATEMIALLKEQSKSDKLSVNQKLALRNMSLIVDSFTSVKEIEPEVKMDLMYEFVTQVLRKLIVSNDLTYVLELLSKINFAKDENAQHAFLSVYAKPELMVSDKLELMAELLRRLDKKNAFLITMVVDNLTEGVIRCMERNDYRQNVTRIAHMKLVAALFNRKVLSFKSVIDLLFKIVCFDYPNNLPLPGSSMGSDLPDDYIRINLVCALLNSIEIRKVAKEKLLEKGVKTLEGFMIFFSYYICCKQHPLPMNVRFNIDDLFRKFNLVASRPLDKPTDVRSAMVALQKYSTAENQIVESSLAETETSEDESSDESDFLAKAIDIGSGNNQGSEAENSEKESDGDDFDDDDEEEEEDDDEDVESDDEDDDEDNDTDTGSSEDSDSEYLSDSQLEDELEEERSRAQQQLELAELERKEAQNMDNAIKEIINKTTQNVRSTTTFKVPAPSSLLGNDTARKGNFTFLSKSNKVRDLAMPSDNQFAERIAREQQAQRANREKIMSLLTMQE